MKRNALFLFGLLLAFGAFSSGALAEVVEIQPIFNQKGLWDSNPQMLARGEKAIYGSTTSPKLSIKSETPRSRLETQITIDQNLFNDSSYNSTDVHARANLARRSERWEASLRAGTDYDTTRTSELTNFGQNVGKVRHFSYDVGPEVVFLATQRDRISLAGSFERSVYKSDLYSDYSVISLSPTYTRSLTPLTSGLFAVQAQRFQSEGFAKRRVDSIGPSAGFATELSPNTSLRVSAGSQASQERRSGEEEGKWKWHYVYSADLTFKEEANDASLKASRARRPFGNGTDALLTTFALDVNHEIHERFRLSFGASYQIADYDQDPGNSMDNMATGRTGLAYHLTETFDVDVGYNYRNERFIDGSRAQQSVARLGLTYRPLFDGASF